MKYRLKTNHAVTCDAKEVLSARFGRLIVTSHPDNADSGEAYLLDEWNETWEPVPEKRRPIFLPLMQKFFMSVEATLAPNGETCVLSFRPSPIKLGRTIPMPTMTASEALKIAKEAQANRQAGIEAAVDKMLPTILELIKDAAAGGETKWTFAFRHFVPPDCSIGDHIVAEAFADRLATLGYVCTFDLDSYRDGLLTISWKE